jgi:hypothetical protein
MLGGDAAIMTVPAVKSQMLTRISHAAEKLAIEDHNSASGSTKSYFGSRLIALGRRRHPDRRGRTSALSSKTS